VEISSHDAVTKLNGEGGCGDKTSVTKKEMSHNLECQGETKKGGIAGDRLVGTDWQ